MKARFLWVGIFFMTLTSLSFGQADSEWRGPNRDGVYPGEQLAKQWPAAGPKLLWAAEGLGEGFSQAAVTGQRVYITGMLQGIGHLFALDSTGKVLWKTAYGPEWTKEYQGARTTPTVVGKQIFLMSAHGQVFCFGLNGEKLWSVDLMKEFKAPNIQWGMTESLLVEGDRVYCTPGGPEVAMVALDKNTGKTIWKSKGNGEPPSYCSPRLVKHGARRLLLTMMSKSVIGVDADTGEFLWRAPHVTDWDVNPNTPFYQEGRIYTVSGYETGGQMFQLAEDGKSVRLLWTDKKMDSQIGAAVLVDGYLYGSGHERRGWHCIDWKTGAAQFSANEIGGKGNIVFSDGMMYAYSENGTVALIKPNPKKFEVVSSFKINRGAGPHWAHPTIRNGRLYVRHGDVLMVYDIAK